MRRNLIKKVKYIRKRLIQKIFLLNRFDIAADMINLMKQLLIIINPLDRSPKDATHYYIYDHKHNEHINAEEEIIGKLCP